MAKRNDENLRVVTFDFETDPFEVGRIPEPFCVGFFDGEDYFEKWSDDPDEVVFYTLEVMSEYGEDTVFYAHNGGKFDFHFLIKHADTISDLILIGARIVQMRINGALLRDSYAMIPVPLSKYQKLEIEYWKMEKEFRWKYRDEISRYLKVDCEALFELVTGFIDEFGMSLTMASAAMRELEKFHEYDKMSGDDLDARFRKFYFGGRVEYFEQGRLTGNFKVYDVNSMYPSVMKDYKHPISSRMTAIAGRAASNDKILDECVFAEIKAYSDGAFPWRDPEPKDWRDKKLFFPVGVRNFFVTGHELRTALRLGLCEIKSVRRAWLSDKQTTFEPFVDHFYKARMKARDEGDKLHDLFYKLVLNSAYGKFAQDPSKFRDFEFSDGEMLDPADGWVIAWRCPDTGKKIYERKSTQPEYIGRKNVATAASITGAARARLLEGLHHSERPIYCDTDSVICESLSGVPMHPSNLGAWDLEAEGDTLSVVGRKTYALFNSGECIKRASKGVRATGEEIARVAMGEVLEFENEAPTFSIKKAPTFIKRKVRLT